MAAAALRFAGCTQLLRNVRIPRGKAAPRVGWYRLQATLRELSRRKQPIVDKQSARDYARGWIWSPDQSKPLVEPAPGGEPDDMTARALRQRIRQQELLAELGVLALQGTNFIGMLNHTAQMTAEGLGAEYCKVMEYLPAENRLLVRAGVGWDEGVVGKASVGADLASPAGFALRTGKPVISNHLENEQRFRTPELLVEHGIRRAMNVILQGDGSPFGVLEVDSKSEGEFGEHDVAFLQGAANILGMAIEQQHYQRKLQAALDRHQVLLERSQPPHQEQPAGGFGHASAASQRRRRRGFERTPQRGGKSRQCGRPRL